MNKKDGGPAYPIWNGDMNLGDTAGPGMSLRDYFAGQALASSLGNIHEFQIIAELAYKQADAMLKEREKAYG